MISGVSVHPHDVFSVLCLCILTGFMMLLCSEPGTQSRWNGD